MRFKSRLRATVTMPLIALLAGCAATVIRPSASPCSALLPDEWTVGVAPAAQPESAKLADGHDDARPWQSGFVEQTGQLEVANGRYTAAVGIVGRCEARDAAAIAKARPKVLGIF
ncbi:hypothetical protein [Sphingomonas sp. PAMC 26621]|uniref:hypothetical protein n=1 Tax=Sphingomonas sp. PAMC 26621 TaxID=1112213 RepID=UPI0014793A9B|nr:hypothetical protein [Sphingomonas sp. PAMC 26621]